MGFFSRKKIVDLTEGYSRKRQNSEKIAPSGETSSSGNFFALSENSESSLAEQSPRSSESLGPDEKRRRLARRLKDMTDRLEELSNSIYLLQQRVEVLEKKTGVGRGE